eukprot:gene11472-8162_t
MKSKNPNLFKHLTQMGDAFLKAMFYATVFNLGIQPERELASLSQEMLGNGENDVMNTFFDKRRWKEKEEARAQGKSLEEIRRAIEGLDELDEDGESTVADGGAGGSTANDLDTLTEGGESYRRSRRGGGGGGVGGSSVRASTRTMGSDAAVSVADDDTIAS